MNIKFPIANFTYEIEHELFTHEVSIPTQEIMDNWSYKVEAWVRNSDRFDIQDGLSRAKAASEFINNVEDNYQDYWDSNGDISDAFILAFIQEHKFEIVSFLEAQLLQVAYAGHMFFMCTFSDLHDAPQLDQCCEKCQPYIRRSTLA